MHRNNTKNGDISMRSIDFIRNLAYNIFCLILSKQQLLWEFQSIFRRPYDGVLFNPTDFREKGNFCSPDTGLCVEKRIPGAVKIGYSWAIPADAENPKDARVKSGKYIKSGTWPN